MASLALQGRAVVIELSLHWATPSRKAIQIPIRTQEARWHAKSLNADALKILQEPRFKPYGSITTRAARHEEDGYGRQWQSQNTTSMESWKPSSLAAIVRVVGCAPLKRVASGPLFKLRGQPNSNAKRFLAIKRSLGTSIPCFAGVEQQSLRQHRCGGIGKHGFCNAESIN